MEVQQQIPGHSPSGEAGLQPAPALEPERTGWGGRRKEALSSFALLLIMLLAAYFRFTGLEWDGSHHLHPDERFLTDLGSLLRPTYDPFTYLRTSESPLNPYNVGKSFYVYGNFPMTVTRFVAEWATSFCGNFLDLCQHVFNSYNGIHLVGRVLSGSVDLLSLLFLFLIGRRLYGRRAALLAGLLFAAAVMPIQQSHFFTMDNWASALATMSLYAAVRAGGLGDTRARFQLRWWALFGLGLGLSVASRVNMAPLAIMINVSAVIWMVRRGHSWRSLWHSSRAREDAQHAILGIALAASLALLTFRLAQPYAFADGEIARLSGLAQSGQEPGGLGLMLRSLVGFNPQWRANMAEIQRLQAPEASFPPALQWTGRPAILFPLTNMILYGMGITAGIAAWLGLLWALWRIVQGHPEWSAHAIPVFWSAGYFLFMGTRWVKSVRYFLPVYPMLLLLAGWALVTLWRRSRAKSPIGRGRIVAGGLIVLVVAPSLLWANAFVKIYQRPVTRVAASDWMFENVPTGATLLYETDRGSHQLQLPLRHFDFFPMGSPLFLEFVLPEDGTIQGVRFNYLSNLEDEAGTPGLRLTLDQMEPVEATWEWDRAQKAVTIGLPETQLEAETRHLIMAELAPASGAMQAETSRLLVEHWDDALPVGLDGRNAFGSYYASVTDTQVPVTNPDDEEKRRQLLDWLDEADFVVLSSQRALWHLPRLPLNYPLMIRYYEALFGGQLGFELATAFHADLRIGPLYISDTTGKLGWGSPPNVGWPPPGSLAAEEAFSVYDHPPVWIFAKSDAYNRDAVARLFGEVDLSQRTNMNPSEATRAPNGLQMSAEETARQRAGGTFRDLFNADGTLSRHGGAAALVWWLTVILLGWLAFPIAFAVFPGLPDRGYGLARILSLLLISYLAWLAASLDILPYTKGSLMAALLLVAAASLLIALRQRRTLIPFLRAQFGYVLVAELLGTLLFLVLIGVRLGNPDVWDVIWGGEKPMDLAYFTAVQKSTSFPPYDPWYAGGYINYYYYGFVFAGVLAKLLGIVPTVAYNLILPMLFSFTGLGVFSIAYNLVVREGRGSAATARDRTGRITAWLPALRTVSRRGAIAGLIAAATAVILGNLAEIGVLVNAWYRAGSELNSSGIGWIDGLARTFSGAIRMLAGNPAPISPGDWFWNASRAINYNPGEVGPITEFPFFTFLYADLHAHMVSMPLMILALGWAVGLALQPVGGDPSRSPTNSRSEVAAASANGRSGGSLWVSGLQWLVGGLAIGVLRATNTWDWPTYLVIGGLAVLLYRYRKNGRFDLKTVGQAGLLSAILVMLSILLFWPYARNFGVGYASFKLWPGSYTQLTNYLTIYGLFLFFVVTYLTLEFRAWTGSWNESDKMKLKRFAGPLLIALFSYPLVLLFFLQRGNWIVPVVLTLVLASGLLGLRRELSEVRRITLILISASLALTLFVELFVLDGDIGRMNTVFKYYLQVWLILSVVSGVAAVRIWPSLNQRGRFRQIWRRLLYVLIFLAALYPILATKAKWDIRMSKEAPNSLDGMAFMPYVAYGDSGETVSLAGDYKAIQWIYRNIEGSPVIAEAHSSNPYRSIGNRISMYTGLPTIVGWDWHQRQQRAVLPGTLVSNRIQDVNRLYNTAVVAETKLLLDKYDVEYIYAGELESVYYDASGLAKFDLMVDAGYLEKVYQDGETRIYRVLN